MKVIDAPVLHVNGDDPEAVVLATKLAVEFRTQFHKDVAIDIVCFRKLGHNEQDTPSMTQPLMYAKIKGHPSTQELYSKRLIGEGVISQADVDGWIKEFDDFLDSEFEAGKSYKPNKADWLDGKWAGLTLPKGEDSRSKTGVSVTRLKELGRQITAIPEGFDIHKTVKRMVDGRREAIESGVGIDWALGEHLAFATLLDEGTPVRLSGQDSVRGTFTQRHSDFIDQTNEEHYTPLNNIRPGQASYEVIDSALSEEAVLGFEYGFSLADPNTLTLWEGQFGDFVNGAQVVIDQFITSGERKWLRMSGLVMLLPHGYEGQGPEHSSARLERFLQSCAEDNMQVVNCTTPANYYHALRRQMHREFRKPLMVMTPKSLLRHKRAVSNLADFAEANSFHRVMVDGAEAGCDVGGVTLKADVPDDDLSIGTWSSTFAGANWHEREAFEMFGISQNVSELAMARRAGVYGYHQSSLLPRLLSVSTNFGRVSSASTWRLLVTPVPEPRTPVQGAPGMAAVKPWLLMVTSHLAYWPKAAKSWSATPPGMRPRRFFRSNTSTGPRTNWANSTPCSRHSLPRAPRNSKPPTCARRSTSAPRPTSTNASASCATCTMASAAS